MVRIFKALLRVVRRKYYLTFKADYVHNQIKTRKGMCGRHGCCDLTVVNSFCNKKIFKCLSLLDRTECLRWDRLPEECKAYPFDEKDKIPETRIYCNFHWDK